MESVGYCVRVQALEGYSDKIGALTLTPDYVAVLAVRHTGAGTKENPHYHVVIRTGVKPQAFRVRFKTLFPDGKGNGHMSIVPWDGDDKALSYLFHEADDQTTLVARKGVTDDQIAHYKSLNSSIKIKVEEAKKKASHTLEEDAFLHFQANPKLDRDNWRIGAFMFLYAMRNGKYPPQRWLVQAMVTRVQFRLLNGDIQREENMAEGFAKDIFCRYD